MRQINSSKLGRQDLPRGAIQTSSAFLAILFSQLSYHRFRGVFMFYTGVAFGKIKNSLTVIIPRHIDRCKDIISRLQNLGLKVHLHSDKSNIDKKTDIYLVDSFGETNSFINQCNIVFLGGSMIKHGGQNPLEAVRYGCKVFHGPNVSNFEEIYSFLDSQNISYGVSKRNEMYLSLIHI